MNQSNLPVIPSYNHLNIPGDRPTPRPDNEVYSDIPGKDYDWFGYTKSEGKKSYSDFHCQSPKQERGNWYYLQSHELDVHTAVSLPQSNAHYMHSTMYEYGDQSHRSMSMTSMNSSRWSEYEQTNPSSVAHGLRPVSSEAHADTFTRDRLNEQVAYRSYTEDSERPDISQYYKRMEEDGKLIRYLSGFPACSFKTGHKATMERHVEKQGHLGIKYTCEKCRKRFARKDTMREHIQKKHGQSND